jgi:hypothetical protein
MLGGQEEVMMLVKQSTMQSNQGLPLLVIQLRLSAKISRCQRCLLVINFNTFGLDHY